MISIAYRIIEMEDEMKKHEDISRRDAMKIAISLIGGLISTALGIPAIAYIIGPALKTDLTNWIRVGSLSTIELGRPTLFKPKVTREKGWVVEGGGGGGLRFKKGGEEV